MRVLKMSIVCSIIENSTLLCSCILYRDRFCVVIFPHWSSLCLTLLFNPIPKPSSLVSWSQICLLNSIAVFETVRSYKLKKACKSRGHKFVLWNLNECRRLLDCNLFGTIFTKIFQHTTQLNQRINKVASIGVTIDKGIRREECPKAGLIAKISMRTGVSP